MSGATWTPEDEAAASYNPAGDGYDLARDPRCLWGWGPPTGGCHHMFGHACFRALGHDGPCSENLSDPLPCEEQQRPHDWDHTGRAKANR